MAPLYLTVLGSYHVIPQVVKAKFIVGTVCDVGSVSLPALGTIQTIDNQTGCQAQIAINLAHPFRVTLCQIVIDSNYMHTLACQCIQITGQSCHQGFTFTGLHFRNASLMQHQRTQDLNREMLHFQYTPAGFPTGGKSLRQNIIEGFTICQTRLELVCHTTEFRITHGSKLIFQRQYLIDCRLEPLYFFL